MLTNLLDRGSPSKPATAGKSVRYASEHSEMSRSGYRYAYADDERLEAYRKWLLDAVTRAERELPQGRPR